ncbi:hypothetical protein BF49_4186 [Bradyrhizobium sp.]|nr:hypothetical protein BF49_4186 [Bradyrhizobium sp.]
MADQEHGFAPFWLLDEAARISFHGKAAVAQAKSWEWSIAPDATAPRQRLPDALSRTAS